MKRGRLLVILALVLLSSPIWGQVADHMLRAGFFGSRVPPESNTRQFRSAPAVEEHSAQRTLSADSLYDPSNPDLGRLQSHKEAVQALPKDSNGFPDWMRALRDGSIEPRAGLEDGARMNVLNLDIIMKNTKEMPFVRFPHTAHTQWLECSNCHPRPFEPRVGSSKLAMADIFRGKYCGMCHDRVAFVTFFSCARCHSVPQPTNAAAK